MEAIEEAEAGVPFLPAESGPWGGEGLGTLAVTGAG